MVTFLLYIVKSTCCLTLFYLGYKALLSNETFFRFNRMVLLAGMLVCMLLPFVELRTESPGAANAVVAVGRDDTGRSGGDGFAALRCPGWNGGCTGCTGGFRLMGRVGGLPVSCGDGGCPLPVGSLVCEFALADPERREDTERALYAGAGRQAGRSF